MTKTKYIMSDGLAFSEDKDMEKLRKFSLKGWHVKGFKFMGYTLEKGESIDYIYSVDYRPLRADEEDEYFDLLSSAGWSHIASDADIHLFRATPGTNPIYSDRDTSVEKYTNLSKPMTRIAIPFILLTAIVWIIALFSGGNLKTVFLVGATVLSMFALPLAWTSLAAYSTKLKVKGNDGMAILLKTVPVIVFLIAVVILLFTFSADHAVRVLISAMIGGIALPTIIWGIMSLSHKIGGR